MGGAKGLSTEKRRSNNPHNPPAAMREITKDPRLTPAVYPLNNPATNPKTTPCRAPKSMADETTHNNGKSRCAPRILKCDSQVVCNATATHNTNQARHAGDGRF